MTTTSKRIVSILLAGLVLVTGLYFEGEGLEVHRLLVALIGLTEAMIFIRVLAAIETRAIEKNWAASKTMRMKTFSSIGLIVIMVIIDRLIDYTLNYYNKDYKIIWTIVIPGTILIASLFKLLDIWSYENEKRDEIRET
jgi:hypothetical protein